MDVEARRKTMLHLDYPVPRSAPARYALALGFLTVATLLRAAIDPLVGDQIPFEIYMAASVVAAWFAGTRAALVGVAIAAFVGDYLFVSPRYDPGPSGDDWIRMLSFTLLAAGLVWLVSRWRQSEERAHAHNAELQEALKALRASERLYRAIGESIDYGVWVCEPDGRNIFASESFLRLVGLTQEQCSNFGWGDVLHPDDAERTIAAWKECVRTGGTWDIEHRFRGVDGKWHPILARGVPVRDEAGQIVCWGGINLDFSRLKAAEEALRAAKQRLESLLENSPLAVIEWSSTDFRIVRWSDEASRLFGWTAEETIGKRIDGLPWIYPDDQALVEQTMAGMLDGSRPRSVSRNRNVRKDGTIVHCEWYNSTLRDVPDQLSVLSLVLDVTERERAVEDLAAANRAKDEFLSVLSHELRTPLNAMLGWSDMLSRQVLDADTTRRAVHAIGRNARAQLALINDVLDVSRIVSGKFRLDVRPVDLGDILRGVVDATRPAADARQLTVTLSIGPETFIVGDPDRLQQIFWNLLSNSVKFTQPGGRVEVSAALADNQVRVRVRDTGVGISADFLPHVFERFRQADSSTTRSPQSGLGLGLAIVRHLTELHGGTVTAESAGVGRGSTFTVTLPLAAQAVTREPDALAHGADAELPASALLGLRIVVVDDHDEARLLLETALGRYGAAVTACPTAAAGIEAIERIRPNVVVADIGMPGMDGYEMMRRVRAHPSLAGGPPAIAVTAYGTAEDRRRALSAGYQDHVAKPVVPEQLVRIIGALTRARA
jgi:PAS domain S-box-containing protein